MLIMNSILNKSSIKVSEIKIRCACEGFRVVWCSGEWQKMEKRGDYRAWREKGYRNNTLNRGVTGMMANGPGFVVGVRDLRSWGVVGSGRRWRREGITGLGGKRGYRNSTLNRGVTGMMANGSGFVVGVRDLGSWGVVGSGRRWRREGITGLGGKRGYKNKLALTVLGTFLASLEILSELILNMPGAITLALFTPLDTCGVETELEVTVFDKAFVSPILERVSTIGCFANLVFLLEYSY
nr:hypothetical protein [Tanacetum cinerariifolium]